VLESDLLYTNKAKINNFSIPDLKINPGDIAFIEAKDVFFSNIFVSIIYNQIKLEEGKIIFSGTKPNINNFKKISYISNAFYFPIVNTIDDLIKYTSYRKNQKASFIYNNFYKILKNINLDYVKDMNIESINFNTRKKIITALTLAFPMLLIIINEPFIDIDFETKEYFFQEINDKASEGSAIIILGSDPDKLNYKLTYRGF